jgi:hypothetical protein
MSCLYLNVSAWKLALFCRVDAICAVAENAAPCNGNQSEHAPPFIFLLHTGKALKKATPPSWKEDEM